MYGAGNMVCEKGSTATRLPSNKRNGAYRCGAVGAFVAADRERRSLVLSRSRHGVKLEKRMPTSRVSLGVIFQVSCTNHSTVYEAARPSVWPLDSEYE